MKRLFYRVVPHNGGVVFAEQARAALIARIHDAINGATTWSEFRAAMPRDEYSRLIRSTFDADGEPRPKGADDFSGECIPGWCDGDYPPWLQKEMDRLLPKEVLAQFGVRQDTWVNGSFWMIPERCLEPMCEALRSLGWELQHEPELAFH